MRTKRQRPVVLAFAALTLLLMALGAAASPALAQDATATIELSIYACPPELDAYAASPDELLAGCFFGEDFPPLSFTLELPDGSVSETETSAALATFTDVPAGEQVTLSEILPEGLGEPVVACTVTNDADGAVILEPTLVPVVNGNAIEIEPEAGQTLSCSWFNVFGTAGQGDSAEDTSVAEQPATPPAGASIEIVVHGCPVGVDPAATAAQFLETCTGHPVTLLSAADFEDYHEADTTSGIAGDNAVQFAGVPATGITLSQQRPQSERTVAVFCADAATAGDPATWEQADVANGVSVDLEIPADGQLTCHWFNDGGDVEGDASGSTVEIRAWTCVPGTELGADEWSYYFEQCDTVDMATTFTLTDDAGARPAELAGDWSTWTGVANREFTITGAIPDGFGEPVVVCGAYEGGSLAIAWPVASNGAFAAAFEGQASQIMTCDWFNIPTAGTLTLPELTVIVHTCPTAEFVTAADCTVDTDGATVSLMRWNGDPAVWAWESQGLSNVDDQGSRTFDQLEPADYWIEGPDGDWCHVASEWLDESGNWINVDAGQETTVMVYACAAPVGMATA